MFISRIITQPGPFAKIASRRKKRDVIIEKTTMHSYEKPLKSWAIAITAVTISVRTAMLLPLGREPAIVRNFVMRFLQLAIFAIKLLRHRFAV